MDRLSRRDFFMALAGVALAVAVPLAPGLAKLLTAPARPTGQMTYILAYKVFRQTGEVTLVERAEVPTHALEKALIDNVGGICDQPIFEISNDHTQVAVRAPGRTGGQ